MILIKIIGNLNIIIIIKIYIGEYDGELTPELTYDLKAGNIPEFSFIKRIEFGIFDNQKDKLIIDIDILEGNEIDILNNFVKILQQASTSNYVLGGFNILNYDIPLFNSLSSFSMKDKL